MTIQKYCPVKGHSCEGREALGKQERAGVSATHEVEEVRGTWEAAVKIFFGGNDNFGCGRDFSGCGGLWQQWGWLQWF